MMKKNMLLILISIFYSCNLKSQETNGADIQSVKLLFAKVEGKMAFHYNYVKKKRLFEDPLGRISFFFETVKNNSPELLSNNFEYKKDLLNILEDTSFRRNIYTDNDIAYLLYNSDIEDYIDIMQQVCIMFKQRKISYQTLEYFLFQDPNVSCLVAKSYMNKNVSYFFGKMLSDKTLIEMCQNYNKTFVDDIENLKNGETWNGDGESFGLKKLSVVQVPILDTLRIK